METTEDFPQKGVLNANALKLIAILAMTVDHIAWAVSPGYPVALLPLLMHLIGRITCPVMCYFVAEGFHYTHNARKYLLRMLLFAFVSHFAYIYAGTGFSGLRSFVPFSNGSLLNQTSVMWSLALGLAILMIQDDKRLKPLAKTLLTLLCLVLALPADWSCIASLCVVAFGTNRGKFRVQMLWMLFYVALYALVYYLAIDMVYGFLQMGVCLSIPILLLYNGKRGKSVRVNRIMKWFFYIYYPLHLFVIGLLLHFAG